MSIDRLTESRFLEYLLNAGSAANAVVLRRRLWKAMRKGDPEQARRFAAELESALRALPGIRGEAERRFVQDAASLISRAKRLK